MDTVYVTLLKEEPICRVPIFYILLDDIRASVGINTKHIIII